MLDTKAVNRPFLVTLLALILCAESGFAFTVLPPEPEKKAAIPRARVKSVNRANDTSYHLMELSYLTLNAIDLVTTFHSLDKGAKELNPIARIFIENKPLAIALKGGLSLTVLYSLRKVKKQNKTAAYLTLGILNGFYSYVATNNIIVSFQLSR